MTDSVYTVRYRISEMGKTKDEILHKMHVVQCGVMVFLLTWGY
jgi:hypothetical protein